MNNQGVLYLIPSFIGNTDNDKSFPLYNQEIISKLRTFIVEDIKTARKFLRKAGYKANFDDDTVFYELNEHNIDAIVSEFFKSLKNGEDIGLFSEAGAPCVADPGNIAVAYAHSQDIRVVPLVGPNSILMCLMASGMNGQNFAFNGYLPIDKSQCIKKIKALETKVYKENQTQLFMETPYRNIRLLEIIFEVCSPSTTLTIACDISSSSEWIKTKSIKQWKASKKPDIHKRPTVFSIYK